MTIKTTVYTFDDKISSTSPGQACVFYLKDQVLGGGWITNSNNLEYILKILNFLKDWIFFKFNSLFSIL